MLFFFFPSFQCNIPASLTGLDFCLFSFSSSHQICLHRRITRTEGEARSFSPFLKKNFILAPIACFLPNCSNSSPLPTLPAQHGASSGGQGLLQEEGVAQTPTPAQGKLLGGFGSPSAAPGAELRCCCLPVGGKCSSAGLGAWSSPPAYPLPLLSTQQFNHPSHLSSEPSQLHSILPTCAGWLCG